MEASDSDLSSNTLSDNERRRLLYAEEDSVWSHEGQLIQTRWLSAGSGILRAGYALIGLSVSLSLSLNGTGQPNT